MDVKSLYIVFLLILILYLVSPDTTEKPIEPFNDITNDLQAQVNVQTEKSLAQSSPDTLKELKQKSRKEKYIAYKQKTYTKLLKDTKEVMDELKIPFFLSSGTCLGYYREGKFIDHDYDIDVGIFEKDYTKKIIDKMAEKGLKLYRVLGDRETGMELSFRRSGTRLGRFAKIDVFLHYNETVKNKKQRKKQAKTEHCCWYTYKYPQFKEKIKYRVSKFDLEPVEFMGMIVNVPSPTETYILEHYGDDWMVPKRAGVDYFYATSPKSIVKEKK